MISEASRRGRRWTSLSSHLGSSTSPRSSLPPMAVSLIIIMSSLSPPASSRASIVSLNGFVLVWIAVNGNQRKRGREPSGAAAAAAFQMVPTPQMNLFSPSIQSPALITLAQLQNQTYHPPPPPSLVSTGLRLSFEDSNQTLNQSQSQSQSNPFIQQDLAALINHQKDEIEQYLIVQVPKLAILPSSPLIFVARFSINEGRSFCF